MYIHFISQIYCADQIKEIITKNQNTVSQNFLPIWFVFEKIHCNQTMGNFVLFFYLFVHMFVFLIDVPLLIITILFGIT
jgi:long-subunit acyl-CoA synthetase (AMP-forming)